MQCPVCEVALDVSVRNGIEVDHCPQCRGVWLDRGELDKLLDGVAERVELPRRQPHRDDHDHDRYDDRDRKKKSKSKRAFGFLEDLLEFD